LHIDESQDASSSNAAVPEMTSAAVEDVRANESEASNVEIPPASISLVSLA
jgi:hypothetical protein